MRIILIVLAIIIIGALAVWFFGGRENMANVPPDGPITIAGTIVCLPHADTDGPQTLECAYGLLGEDENYYMLQDSMATSGPSSIVNIPTDTDVEIEGTFTAGTDDTYATVGTIDVIRITPEDGAMPEADAMSHSDGTIMWTMPEDFGLAVTEEQILIESAVPPCSTPFAYCLYYLGSAYENTNFESAGLTIRKEESLTTEDACLTTPPAGYTDLTPAATSTGDGYAMSVFGPLQDAATGQYTNGEEYSLFTDDVCYTFTIRVGESQLENMPTGTEEFTPAEREAMLDMLRTILGSFTLEATGETLDIPRA